MNLTTCSACGQTDTDPKHLMLTDLLDDAANHQRHLDCCLCTDSCAPLVVESGDLHGAELAAWLIARGT